MVLCFKVALVILRDFIYSVGEDGVDNGGRERTEENRLEDHDVTFTVERSIRQHGLFV